MTINFKLRTKYLFVHEMGTQERVQWQSVITPKMKDLWMAVFIWKQSCSLFLCDLEERRAWAGVTSDDPLNHLGLEITKKESEEEKERIRNMMKYSSSFIHQANRKRIRQSYKCRFFSCKRVWKVAYMELIPFLSESETLTGRLRMAPFNEVSLFRFQHL